ncbi:MAG TPA: ethanolamine ammonia-lyase reactivating factor EutA [Hyphomicrobiaceae bacterium]|nr:ethanolamine ammonia-lyase reactivating factor EutA [Hyphomicrobiaceae bacterium]
MHDTDFLHEHDAMSEADRAELARYIWAQETVELKTVGIDIGSSTSHLMFAKVTLQRQTQGLSSRFVVVEREIIWRSPIMLTPFLTDGTIDAGALDRFIGHCYRSAGLQRSDIDTGAVILTGEAIKRRNARAIDELFAQEAGKFVCATAGHKLECLLAAHGSGAVALSKARGACLLHVDIGGGTCKLALIDRGVVLGTAAFAVGGRLLAKDAAGAWSRVDHSARLVAEELGLATTPVALADPSVRARIAARLADIAADYILGAAPDALAASLLLTETLPRTVEPQALSFSGGVAEYVFGAEEHEYGDIAKLLASELCDRLSQRSKLPVIDPGQRIRATVIGASQFTVQVSGKTIFLPEPEVLPVHNIPVVPLGLDLAGAIEPTAVAGAIRAGLRKMDLAPQARLALALVWDGEPEYVRLEALARGIADAFGGGSDRDELLVMMIDGDIGKTLGRLLRHELAFTRKLASIDGVQLRELDYVDVGAPIDPPGVVPVVIKSLLFA